MNLLETHIKVLDYVRQHPRTFSLQISAALNMPQMKVSLALRDLVDSGLVSREERIDHGIHYFVYWCDSADVQNR